MLIDLPCGATENKTLFQRQTVRSDCVGATLSSVAEYPEESKTVLCCFVMQQEQQLKEMWLL